MAIEDGFNTTTQRQQQFAQLMYLKQAGIDIPSDVLLKAATIQNKNDLIEAVQKQEQAAAKQQQAQSQAAMFEQQATAKLAQARAAADIGLGMERQSRVKENEQLARERNASAQKQEMDAVYTFTKALNELKKSEPNTDETTTILNLLKAIKQLEAMDIDNVAKGMANEQQLQQMFQGQQQRFQQQPSPLNQLQSL